MENEISKLSIEKKIQLYDKMNKAYGFISEELKAGEIAKEIGLIGKAIEFYNASGKGNSKECQELEKWISKPEETMKKDAWKAYNENFSNPEAKKVHPSLWYVDTELIEEVPGYYFIAELNASIGEKN